MRDRPPSPQTPPSPTPTAPPTAETEPVADADPGAFDRQIVATTPELAATIEDRFGIAIDGDDFEDFLVDLDRRGYVEWIDVTRDGTYVWDLSGTSARIADAIADAVVARFRAWFAADA